MDLDVEKFLTPRCFSGGTFAHTFTDFANADEVLYDNVVIRRVKSMISVTVERWQDGSCTQREQRRRVNVDFRRPIGYESFTSIQREFHEFDWVYRDEKLDVGLRSYPGKRIICAEGSALAKPTTQMSIDLELSMSEGYMAVNIVHIHCGHIPANRGKRRRSSGVRPAEPMYIFDWDVPGDVVAMKARQDRCRGDLFLGLESPPARPVRRSRESSFTGGGGGGGLVVF